MVFEPLYISQGFGHLILINISAPGKVSRFSAVYIDLSQRLCLFRQEYLHVLLQEGVHFLDDEDLGDAFQVFNDEFLG